MKIRLLFMSVLVAAASSPTFAQADQQTREGAREFMVQRLPGMKWLANTLNDHGKYFDLSYNGPGGLSVGDLGASIETRDPCWIQFDFHRGAFEMNDFVVPEVKAPNNFDFRNIDTVFTDGARVFLKNPHWGPYPSVLYASDAAAAARFAGAMKVMMTACKGVP